MAPGLDPLRFDYPVASLDDLMAVVGRLRTSLAEDPNSWENPTLGRFLEAMEAWLSTFPQAYVNVGEETPTPDWRFVADLLRAARIYE